MPPLGEINPNTPPTSSARGKHSNHRKGRHLTDQERASIMTLRIATDKSCDEIHTLLGVKQATASQVVRKAQEAAGSNAFLLELLAYAHTKPQEHKPIVASGFKQSIRLRSAMLNEKENNLPFQEVLENHGINVSRSTADKSAHKHRDGVDPYRISHTKQDPKPMLSDETKDSRYKLSLWGLEELKKDAIFIFSDETYIEIGGPPRHAVKIFHPAHLPAPDIHPTASQFERIALGAISTDIHIQQPFYVWKGPETPQEKVASLEKLKAENIRKASPRYLQSKASFCSRHLAV